MCTLVEHLKSTYPVVSLTDSLFCKAGKYFFKVKRTSLFCFIVSDGKKFCNIDSQCPCYTTFFLCHRWCDKISWSVCYWQLFPPCLNFLRSRGTYTPIGTHQVGHFKVSTWVKLQPYLEILEKHKHSSLVYPTVIDEVKKVFKFSHYYVSSTIIVQCNKVRIQLWNHLV